MSTRRRLLEYRLCRLDPVATERLVVDLWRARGFEVTVEGGVIDARSAHRRDRIYVGRTADAPAAADTVIDLRGEASGSVRTLDAAGLAERLMYAVEPAERRSLSERHLGSPPAGLDPPVHWRVRGRLASMRPALPALVAIATLVLVAATMATAPAPVDSGRTADTSEPRDAGAEGLGDRGSNVSVVVPQPSFPTGPPAGYLNGSIDIGHRSFPGNATT